jgi:hypothetical protein
MKTGVALFLLLLAAKACFAAEPSGELVELHSCDLYTGGCTASSEATLLGRQRFCMWLISRGFWAGQDLAGTRLALLEVGSENLAEKGAVAERAEIFIPRGTAPEQKKALLSWLETEHPLPASTSVSDTDICYRRTGNEAELSVGDTVAVSTVPLGKCRTGSCGQALWYEPISRQSSFSVVSSRNSIIRDGRLHLTWTDHDRPNVFLAAFGPGAGSTPLAGAPCLVIRAVNLNPEPGTRRPKQSGRRNLAKELSPRRRSDGHGGSPGKGQGGRSVGRSPG